MEIHLTKGGQRNTLTCKRDDGTMTTEDIGPSFPYHDLAHYVVETKCGIANGFFGAIKAGRNIAELSDKEVIQQLGPESWLAEILTRNLQAIGVGAVTTAQYIEVVRWETDSYADMVVPVISVATTIEMTKEYDMLCKKWDALGEGERLVLQFS